MPQRAFYFAQILANCAILFAGKSPHLITVNDGGQRRIFIISAITGELLLEHSGTETTHILRMLNHTENLLSAHVRAIRQGKGPVIEGPKTDWEGLVKEQQDLQERIRNFERLAADRAKKSEEELALLKKAQKNLNKSSADLSEMLKSDLMKRDADIEKLKQEAEQVKEKNAADVADLKKEIEYLKIQAEREVVGWKRENDTLRGEVEYHRESGRMNFGRPGQAGWDGTPASSVFGA
jgi:hypothetical protein